jgi:hypothetical protein
VFIITASKGFHMTFTNGWKVSVQWGPGNYGDNHSSMDWKGPKNTDCQSKTAEVAVFNPEGRWMLIDGQQVTGWQTPDQVAKIISDVATGQFKES